MGNPDGPNFGGTPREIKSGLMIKGGLMMTRNDHINIHSTPPIDPNFGDDVCKGDTLNEQELKEYWTKEIRGIQKMLAMSEEKVEMLRENTYFLHPDFLSSDLEYCRGRGLDVVDGETLLGELRRLG